VLGHTENRNDMAGQWFNEWPLDTWVDSPNFFRLREKFLPMLGNELAENPEPDLDDESREALIPVHHRNGNALPSATPP